MMFLKRFGWTGRLAFVGLSMILSACGGGGGGGGVPAPGGGGGPVPTVPTGLSAQVISSTRIDLDWNASSDDVAVMGYMVHGGDSVPTFTMATAYSFTELTPGTEYCFSVAALDGDGNLSDQSPAVCVSTPPTAVSGWTTVRQGTTTDLAAVVWTGTRLVAGGDGTASQAELLRSTDGISWTEYPSTGFGFTEVDDLIYNGSGFVALRSSTSVSTIYTSPDAVSWTMQSYANPGPANAIAWSPTQALYVSVGADGSIRTSGNAVDWTATASPTTEDLAEVRWLNGRFYAVGNGGTILTSVNGTSWSKASTPFPTDMLYSVAWNGKTDPALRRYVATGYSSVLISSDGDTWSAAADHPAGFLDKVEWGGGSANCFAVVGESSLLFTSPDGETWTRRFLPADPYWVHNALNDIVWTGTRFVAVGQTGTVLTSTDGAAWTIATTGSDFEGLCWDGTNLIAAGGMGRMATSTDGAAWSYRYTGSDYHSLRDLVWNGTAYLGVGYDYTLRSTDLDTWEASSEGVTLYTSVVAAEGKFAKTGDYGVLFWDGVTMHQSQEYPFLPWWKWTFYQAGVYLNDILWDGAQYVAVGNGGKIYTSPDVAESSPNWVARTSGTGSALYAVAKGGSTYVAVGAAGAIVTSGNGADWTARTSGVGETLYDVAWTGSGFVAVGGAGRILTSTDGTSWTAKSHGTATLKAVLAGGSNVIAAGSEGTILKKN